MKEKTTQRLILIKAVIPPATIVAISLVASALLASVVFDRIKRTCAPPPPVEAPVPTHHQTGSPLRLA